LTVTVGGARAGAATKSYIDWLEMRERRNKCRCSHQGRVSDKLSGKPEEGFLEVIIRLRRNVVVLQVLLAMEGDGLGLDFALLDVDLVAAKNDGDVLANADEITCHPVK
jgi:hypothetical protein